MDRKLTLLAGHKAIFDQLTDEDLVLLVRSLMQYLNGQDVTPTKQPLVNMAFAALTVNSKITDNRKLTSRENGKLGGRPPKKTYLGYLGFSEAAPADSPSTPNNNKFIKEEIISKEVNTQSDNILSNDNNYLPSYINDSPPNNPPSKKGTTNINICCAPKSPPALADESRTRGQEAPPKPPRLDEAGFCQYWNNAMQGKAIRPIQRIGGQRRQWLMARLNEYGKEAVQRAMDKAAASNFLNGDNGKGWIATFDWFVRPNNFPKVLEGNYDNDSHRQSKGQDDGLILKSDQMDYLKGAW